MEKKEQIKKEEKVETIESLNKEIISNKKKIKKLKEQKEILIKNCTDPKSIYFKSDLISIDASIVNCNAQILLINEKIRRLKRLESQPGQ